MWSAEEIIVISDLHLAAERDNGLFQADERLAEFLRWIHTHLSHCHLFLNGDVFDFLVGKQQVAEINLEDAAIEGGAIIDNHKEVFEALSLIANSEEHKLTILGGNHDPEIALPTVQEKIEQSLKPPASHPTKLSCSHFPIRWLTNGEGAAFKFGEAKVLIEHGDQYDSWNWTDHEALRRVICLASRNVSYQKVYQPPPGSRLVLNRLNHIRDQFPWLQTLQPLSPVIIPLALEVILPTLPAGDERSNILKAVKEVNSYAMRSVVDEVLLGIGARRVNWANTNEDRQILSEWLAQYEKEENIWGKVGDAKAWLVRAVARLRSNAVKRKLKSVSGRDTFFDISANDENHDAATRLVDKGADLVMHGHTHAAKAYQVGRGLYLNTGTWGRLTKLPSEEASEEQWGVYIENLKAGRADTLQRLTFARISKQPGRTTAALCEWTDGRAQELSAWSFTGGQWGKVENKL